MQTKTAMVLSCNVIDCAYNRNNECHTIAITVGDHNHAACDTFTRAKSRGGAVEITAGVGACKVEACSHNVLLECTAVGITVEYHQGHGDCKTFSVR